MECPICLCVKEDIFTTKCKHNFCRSCVIQLITDAVAEAKCPVCRQSLHPYDVTCAANGKALMEKPTTIFGGVYVQSGTEGLASYHFNEEESYISYSAAPPYWRLDDGSAPPNKKPFLHSTYDPAIRSFRAVVDWSDINFGGSAIWIYRIVFSEDFMEIESGEVLSYGSAGQKRDWHVYGQNLAYVRLTKQELRI